VREVHGRPPKPHCVEDVDRKEPGEDVSHKQRLQGSPSRVQRGESTKDHWGGVEARSVEIDSSQLVDCLESRSVTRDTVVGGGQTIRILVPGGRAGEDDLDQNSCDVHVAKGARPDGEGARGGPDEHASANNDRRHIVYDSVGQPGEDVEDCVLVRGEDVAEVGAVEDVLEGGEDADPDSRAVVCGYVSGRISMDASSAWG
jgi:hypothetical protein